MTGSHTDEINANLDRADQSLEAARHLLSGEFPDFAASRAYYAVFYAATALLLQEGLEFSKHSGVIASIHQRFVKAGRLAKEHGKAINLLFELRGLGDYGGMAHVTDAEAEEAIEAAASFVEAIKLLIPAAGKRL